MNMAKQSSGAKDARSWLARVCRTVARRRPEVATEVAIAEVPGALRLQFEIGGGSVDVEARPRDDQAAWLHTSALSLNYAVSFGDQEQPRQVRQFLSLLREVIQRADPGNLSIPAQWRTTSTRARPRIVAGWLGRHGPSAQRAHERYASALHRAAFVGWKALMGEDLYPHVADLGEPITEEAIDDGWRDTLARIRTGRAPSKLGIYIHIPFCVTECTFCFCAKTEYRSKGLIASYVEQVAADMQRFGKLFDAAPITSIYVGGGTPSVLKVEMLETLFETLYSSFNVPSGTQVIVEGNPDTLNAAKIEVLARVARATRLTIGVQSLEEEAQRRANRHNTIEGVAAAIEAAQKYGIDHINVDLMAGLDGQTLVGFQHDFERILPMEPDSIHINAFRPVPWTNFAERGAQMSPEQARVRNDILAWGTERLRDHGESLDGHQQLKRRTANAVNVQEYDLRRQNSSLLGLGSAARSHTYANHYYLTGSAKNMPIALEAERRGRRKFSAVRVDEAEERSRYLVHNLRSGFELAEFQELFGTTPSQAGGEGWRQLEELGVVAVSDGRVVSDLASHADWLIYRSLLYGDLVQERIAAVWDSDYDPNLDYRAKLHELVEDDP